MSRQGSRNEMSVVVSMECPTRPTDGEHNTAGGKCREVDSIPRLQSLMGSLQKYTYVQQDHSRATYEMEFSAVYAGFSASMCKSY